MRGKVNPTAPVATILARSAGHAKAGIRLALPIVADLPSRTAARVAILTHAVFASGARQAGNPRAGIVTIAFVAAQLSGRTRIHHAGAQQAGSVFTIAVGAAWIFVLSATWHTLAVQANRGHTTICVVVDLAVTVVVLAIADLSGWPHATSADPAIHAVACKVPRPAFALKGGARRQAGRIAVTGRWDDAVVDNSVAVVVFPIAHFARGPHTVALDLPVHAGAHPLPAFAHRTATGNANPGHTAVRLVDQSIAVIVNAVTDFY